MKMSDEELLLKTLEARQAAHDAPLNPYRLDADGHRWVDFLSRAWSDRANEWMKLAAEVERRGLQQLIPTWNGDSRRSKKEGKNET